MDRVLNLITKIEIKLELLENKDKYLEELDNIKKKYTKELEEASKLKDGELTLRPESLVLLDYRNELLKLNEEVTFDSNLNNIRNYCLNLELTKDNLKEELSSFERAQEQFLEIKTLCDDDTLKELIAILYNTLYKFVYNEVKFFNEDNIIFSLEENEKLNLTKILINEIKNVNNKELEKVLYYYNLRKESILNKDVISTLIKVKEQVHVNKDKKKEIQEVKKKKSLFNNLFKVSVYQFQKNIILIH